MKHYLDEPNEVDGFHLTHIEYFGRTADGRDPDWDKVKTVLQKLRTYVEKYKNETDPDRQM